MNHTDYILNELMELSPAVAKIARVNVFKVPEGYFDSLGSTILMQVHSVETKEISLFKGLAVPEGYFENLADNILLRIKNEAKSDAFLETSQISDLVAGIGNKNIFSVPVEYFDGLENEVTGYLKNEFIPTDNVIEETNSISSLVAGIGNKNVFSFPSGYFNTLADQISQKIKPTAKVVNMSSRINAFRYAAAAVVTGLVGLSVFFMLNKKSDPSTISYQNEVVFKKANDIIKNNSFDKVMASISDKEIVQFLESNGQNVEASLVALLEDDSKLPEPYDYLINENTLDEVLKTIDLNN